MVKSVRIQFDKFLHDTGRAYLIKIGNEEHWLPKKLCRNLVVNKKLGGNLSIPTFLFNDKFGGNIEDASFASEDLIIEKHVPQRKEPVKIEADASLIK